MSNTKDTQFNVGQASSRASSHQKPRIRGLVGRGLVAAVSAAAVTTALLRWNAQPAKRFVQVALSLTAFSLIPLFFSGADPNAIATLVALHVVTAAAVIPSLNRTLHTWDRTD